MDFPSMKYPCWLSPCKPLVSIVILNDAVVIGKIFRNRDIPETSLPNLNLSSFCILSF